MLLNPMTFHTPQSLQELLQLYGSLEGVRLQAGGTFLLSALKLQKRKGTKTPQHIISLYKVRELKGIESSPKALTIKSMTTISDLFDSSLLEGNLSILKTACRNISTQPIRNMATVGGNLTCRYTWTEMPAVMVGLEATMHFSAVDGQTSSIDAQEFYKAAAKTDKIFTHVTINKNPKAVYAYRRIKKTQFVDIPLLSLLIKVEIEAGKIARPVVSVNNCVNFAQRDKNLEEFLNGKALTASLGQEALDHLDETIYDTRSTDYKKYMFRVCVQEAIEELASQKR